MANSYLTHTQTADSSNTKFTFSFWVKRSSIGSTQCIYATQSGNDEARVEFNGNDQLFWYKYNGSSFQWRLQTTRRFRDISAWYHIVLKYDSTQSTSSDRLKMYVNGVEETSFGDADYPSSSENSNFFQGAVAYIGCSENTNSFFDGYLSHVAMTHGYAYAATSFGSTDSTSGIWKFNPPSGVTWGTQGYHLKFENSGALGTDSSGQSNTFAVNGNLTQTVDTPSINWVTFNPLCNSGTGQVAYSRANTRGGTNAGASFLNMMPTSGKWFMEFHFNAAGAGQDNGIGFWSVDEAQRIPFYQSGFKGIVWKYAGNVYANGSNNAFSSNTFTSGDIISVAMDMDNSTATFYKNGSVATNLNAYSFPFTERQAITVGIIDGASASAEDGIFDFNSGANPTFGGRKTAGGNADGNSQGNFSMAVPSGYYALNTKNLNTYG